MEDDLVRVESAVSATSSGNLTWEKWPYDVATALGFAGRRNPLGFAMVRYLDSPSSWTAQEVVLLLATELIRRGMVGVQANDAAWSSFEFWRDARCPHCAGRGVVAASGMSCVACSGTGKRKFDDKAPMVRDGISCLIEAEQWLEGQLSARMRGGG